MKKIKSLDGKISVSDLIIWVAEYSYNKANGTVDKEPPSIVYEQVEKDLINSLDNQPK